MTLLRLFDFHELVQDWKWNRYKTEATASYGLTLLVLNGLGQLLNVINKSSTQSIQSDLIADVIGTILILGLMILAFLWLWKANGGKNGNFFLEKVLSLGVVLTTTRVVPLIVVSVVISLFLQQTAARYVTVFLTVAILAVLLTIIFCLNQLQKSLVEIRTVEYNRSLERHKIK